MAEFHVKCFVVFLFTFSLVLTRKQHKNHHDAQQIQRFVIPKNYSPEDMPTLNDDDGPTSSHIYKKSSSFRDSELPGAYGEEEDDVDTVQDDSDSGSGSASGSGSGNDDDYGDDNVDIKKIVHVKKINRPKPTHHPHRPETAARFGNNVKPIPGINPSAAFVTKEENHNGFKGEDKDIRENKKKHKLIKKKMNLKKGVNVNVLSKKDSDDDDDNIDEGSSMHNEDNDIINKIKNIAKEIDNVEKKRQEKEKEKNKSNARNVEMHDMPKEDVSTKNSNGKKKSAKGLYQADKIKGLDGFECPWSCFWTCQSYCPKECCDNPYNCSSECREICTPYCKEACCAPGAKRLPKLKIPFLPAKVAEKSKTEPQKLAPLDISNLVKLPAKINNNGIPAKINSNESTAKIDSNEIVSKIRQLKQVSDYATQLLGISGQCPVFCSKICTPSLCRPHCCARRTIVNPLQAIASYPDVQNIPSQLNRRENFLNSYPTLPQKPIANMTNNIVQSLQPQLQVRQPQQQIQLRLPQQQLQVRQPAPPIYCASPRDCPEGGIVDPDYCPPICRSSCIEQCPNECCPNFGRKN